MPVLSLQDPNRNRPQIFHHLTASQSQETRRHLAMPRSSLPNGVRSFRGRISTHECSTDWPSRDNLGRSQSGKLTRAGEPSHSVISYQVLAQVLDSETGIDGFDLKKELGSGQLIAEVEGSGSIWSGNELKILVELLALILERLEPGLLHRHAIHQLLPKHFHAAYDIALLQLFPFVVSFDSAIQVLIDGAAGQIVVHGHHAIRLRSLSNRIDLLMHPDGERDIPIILAAQVIQRSLCARFAVAGENPVAVQRVVRDIAAEENGRERESQQHACAMRCFFVVFDEIQSHAQRNRAQSVQSALKAGKNIQRPVKPAEA
jgi:hypothetical protein